MQEIILDAATWETHEDFYAALLVAVGAPDWHGHNLDALNDSLRGGDLNRVNPPFRVRIIGADNLPDDCEQVLARFADLAFDLRARGTIVDLVRD